MYVTTFSNKYCLVSVCIQEVNYVIHVAKLHFIIQTTGCLHGMFSTFD